MVSASQMVTVGYCCQVIIVTVTASVLPPRVVANGRDQMRQVGSCPYRVTITLLE